MFDPEIPRARDTMKKPDLVFSPDEDLVSAINQLVAKRSVAGPVLGADGTLLGMLTEKDCLRILTGAAFEGPQIGPVRDYMSRISVKIEPSMDLFRVAELFLGTNFPMLPVVDESRLVGCVTRQQMLVEIQRLGRQLEEQQQRIEKQARKATERPRSIEDMQQTAASMSPDQLANKLRRT